MEIFGLLERTGWEQDPVTLEGSLAKKLDGYEELVIEYNGAIKETIEMKDD